jgi:hypothetical protein
MPIIRLCWVKPARSMQTHRRAGWLAGVGAILTTLSAGCGDVRSAVNLPNVFAPADLSIGGLVPAAGPPAFKRLLCGGTVKIGVVARCWIELDDAHWGRTLWADFSALYPPKTHWAMVPCGICGRIYEADFRAQVAGEYQIRFWFTDLHGHLRTASVTVTVVP